MAGMDDLAGFFDPTGESVTERKQLAPRVTGLEGKRVGLLINSKPQAEPLMRFIEETLRERFGMSDFKEARSNSQRPAPTEVVEALSACDVVINAIGD